MNEQIKPLNQENSNQLRSIQEIELPEKKIVETSRPVQSNNEEVITNLPSWSIEPPIEIRRGEQ